MELNSGLPDIAHDPLRSLQTQLQWVGMNDIEARALLQVSEEEGMWIPLRVHTQVRLDRSQSRGIHMSRLYLLVQNQLSSEKLSWSLLERWLSEALQSHKELSSAARIVLKFDFPKIQTSLLSGLKSMRNYPVEIEVEKNPQGFSLRVEFRVLYSSTCPASSALSRQLIQKQFREEFLPRSSESQVSVEEVSDWLTKNEVSFATPHAQRSWARVNLKRQSPRSESSAEFYQEIGALIDECEKVLGTPVQGAVKRSDEQEFARLNGENLMFCEDAARRLKLHFLNLSSWSLIDGEVHHVESLHPHEAVAHFAP